MSSINRPPHRLKREKTLTIPRHFVFFDTETKQVHQDDGSIRQVFKLGWAVYYRRSYGKHAERYDWFYISDIESFWQFLFEHVEAKQRLWVTARNIVFDFTVLRGWENLKAEGYKLKFFHNSGVCVIVTVSKGSKSIVFLDSMNWFPESLAKTGERIGIAKMKIDFDTCSNEELSIYCKNDVLIELENVKLFIKFLMDNSISRLCYTRASTAMSAYLFRHYHTDIWIHNNAEAIALERESYKGGRCECFYIGDLSGETYYVLDVNSLYPYVMQLNNYPVKYKRQWYRPGLTEFSEVINRYSVVAKVRIETEEPAYAVRRERTIFPIGEFEATLCTPELRYALEHGHIAEIMDCILYEQADIFTSYVQTIYQYRLDFKQSGSRAYEQLCKNIMNSLYGKFGQKAENWTKIGDCPGEPDREEILFTDTVPRVRRLRYMLGQLFELTSYGESFNSFPAISAHVTAYARMYLWHLMKVCGEGNFAYCDTDSLIVNTRGLVNLKDYIDASELGKLKLEDTITSLSIHGLKDYSTGTKTVVKGIRKTAVQVSEGVYVQDSWPSFKGTLKTKDANCYTVTQVTKHLSREYKKGHVSGDGYIIPYRLKVQDYVKNY